MPSLLPLFITLLPLLATVSHACTETITTACCASAYQVEIQCETQINAELGTDESRSRTRALRRCFRAFEESCEDVIDHGVLIEGKVVVPDLAEFGISINLEEFGISIDL